MSPAYSALVTVRSLTELQKCVFILCSKSDVTILFKKLTCFIKKAGLINPFCSVYCAGISNFL